MSLHLDLRPSLRSQLFVNQRCFDCPTFCFAQAGQAGDSDVKVDSGLDHDGRIPSARELGNFTEVDARLPSPLDVHLVPRYDQDPLRHSVEAVERPRPRPRPQSGGL